MAVSVILDETNPGHFLASCGLLELADRLTPGGAEGWFADQRFHLLPDVDVPTLVQALVAYEAEEVTELSPGFEIKELIRPLRITLDRDRDIRIVLDAWMQIWRAKGVEASGRPPWNFWSGQQTSGRIWRDLRDAAWEQVPSIADGPESLFSGRRFLSGRFGFDPGAAWSALDVGFSPNEQKMDVATSPIVELLAAVGVQRCRPQATKGNAGIRYCTWGAPLGPPAAAAAVNGGLRLSTTRRYHAPVESRGQYGALGRAVPEGEIG